MAKHINIKTGKPQLYGRAPLVLNDKHSNDARTARYNKYQLLLKHYHPVDNKKTTTVKPVIQQLPVVVNTVDTSLKPAKTKWLDAASQWFVDLFTREKSNQEILSGTA